MYSYTLILCNISLVHEFVLYFDGKKLNKICRYCIIINTMESPFVTQSKPEDLLGGSYVLMGGLWGVSGLKEYVGEHGTCRWIRLGVQEAADAR